MEKGVKCFHYKLVRLRIYVWFLRKYSMSCLHRVSLFLVTKDFFLFLIHQNMMILNFGNLTTQKKKFKAAKINNFQQNNVFSSLKAQQKKFLHKQFHQIHARNFPDVSIVVSEVEIYIWYNSKQQTICFFLPCFSRDRIMSKMLVFWSSFEGGEEAR